MLPGLFIQPRQSNKEGKQMAKNAKRKLHKNIQVAFQRLPQRGELLCRQFSNSEEAEKHGNNYLYFTVKDNQKFPTWAGRFLIEKALVKSCADGLFDDTPQTFRAVARSEFDHFKEQYEQV